MWFKFDSVALSVGNRASPVHTFCCGERNAGARWCGGVGNSGTGISACEPGRAFALRLTVWLGALIEILFLPRILFPTSGELTLDMTGADFREAYERHKDLLYRFARRMTGSNEMPRIWCMSAFCCYGATASRINLRAGRFAASSSG